MNKLLFIISLAFFSQQAFAQITLSKVFQENNFTSFEDNHLVLVDFWATWCGPCIQAGKQLEVTQEIYKDDLYILSISNEAHDAISRFIEKHQVKLTIAADYNNATFDFYGVKRQLPYAVLLNQQNELIWEGNPLELSHNQIKSFINKYKSSKAIPADKRWKLKPYAIQESLLSDSTFTIKKTNDKTTAYLKTEDGLLYTGKLSNLLLELLNVDSSRISFLKDFNVEAKIGRAFLKESVTEKLLNKINKALPVKITETSKKLNYYHLEVKDYSTLWNTQQIDWGDEVNISLKNETDLTINNASLFQLGAALSSIFDAPVVYSGKHTALHDWLLPYAFEQILIEDLKNTYGITLKKKLGNISFFEVN